MTFRRWVLGIVAAVLSIAITPVAYAQYSPTPGATFNNPEGTTAARYRILNHVIAAIAHTPPGATMLITSYLFDSDPATEALIAAHDRGVAVQVVFDGGISTAPSHRLASALNADNPAAGIAPRGGDDNSFVVFCRGSCRSDGGHMHTKFYLFSATGVASNVLMVSSSNLNDGGANLGWNDLYTEVGSQAIYDRYAAVHNEMADDTSRDGDPVIDFLDGPYRSRFLPMKEAVESTDPVMQDLSQVGCTSASGHTLINVSMFRVADTRGRYIVDRLLRLARHGCDVNIIYGAPSIILAHYLRNYAHRGLIDLWDSRWDRNDDGFSEKRTHEKYMLIKGQVGSDSSAYRVWNGSSNWGKGSLTTGDELLFSINDRSAWSQYYANWNDVKNDSRSMR